MTLLPSGPLRVRPAALLCAVVIVVAALGLGVFEHSVTASRERSAQKHLAKQLSQLQVLPATGAARPEFGRVFGSIDVPRLGTTGLEIVEGATLSNLRQGPAHDATSQLPGQNGAVVIVGHRATYGAPFARLDQLRVGDVISLLTPSGLYVYRVTRPPTVLRPGAGSLQLPTAAEVRASGGSAAQADQALILATGASSSGQSQSLDVVVATLDRAAAAATPAPGRTSSNVVAQLQSVPGQSIGLVLLLLWLAVALAAVTVGQRLLPRFPPALVVAGASVVVLLSVYQCYLAVDRLVPGTH
jgi:sortase A